MSNQGLLYSPLELPYSAAWSEPEQAARANHFLYKVVLWSLFKDPPKDPADKGESSGSAKGATLSDEDTDKIIDGIMKRMADKALPPTKDTNKKR